MAIFGIGGYLTTSSVSAPVLEKAVRFGVLNTAIGRRTRAEAWITNAILAFVAAGVFFVGVRNNTFSAADTDPYGYVSQAEFLAHGTLRINQQFARAMPWPDAEYSFTPTAYRLGAERGFIVPVYPSGLPMVMALFHRVTGKRIAAFYAVPFLGALTIWVTGRLGTVLHGPLTGVVAALLLATSPIFLYQLLQPVSDVPAAAWWTLSLFLLTRALRADALGAGVAASMAVLTRPNLAPLLMVICGYLVVVMFNQEAATRYARIRQLALFVAGILPGCLVVAFLNQHLHGSPFQTGYGNLEGLYSWSYVFPNLDRYPRWLTETQTPLIFLGIFAPAVLPRSGNPRIADLLAHPSSLLLSLSLGVFCSYLFYQPFGRDEWGYLRFLLPTLPAMLVLSVAVALRFIQRLVPHSVTCAAVSLLLMGGLAAWQAREALDRGVFVVALAERRYVDVGRYIAMAMPRESVFLAGLHSGSIRYYSGRLTMTVDRLHSGSLDRALATLAADGRRLYFALEEGEEPAFRKRFAERSHLGRLDWPPVVKTFRGVSVRIYDPSDRARFLAGEPIVTGDIGLTGRPIVTERGK